MVLMSEGNEREGRREQENSLRNLIYIVTWGYIADFFTFILIKKVLLASQGKNLILPENLGSYLTKTVFARNPPSLGKGGRG